MSSRSQILSQQQQWARSQGLEPDGRGYLTDVSSNLLQPLCDSSRLAFENGSGNELSDGGSRPAKMKALHSSSALAVNFFDYWVTNDSTALTSALGLTAQIEKIRFEAQYPTGLPGTPPNIDVALEMEGSLIIGIESKFTEWLSRKPKEKKAFQPKYFDSGSRYWSSVGLPDCQELAEALQRGTVTYSHLDAPQLLKHALGLASQADEPWSLYYLYFDWSGPEAAVHKEEIVDFETRVGAEIQFRSITYQGLVSRFMEGLGEDNEYVQYVYSRYSASAA